MNDAMTIIGFVGGVAGDEGRLRAESPVVRRHGMVYALSSTTIQENCFHQLGAEDHKYVTLIHASIPTDFGHSCWIAGPDWLANPDVQNALTRTGRDLSGWVRLPSGELVTGGTADAYQELAAELLTALTERLHDTIRDGSGHTAIKTALDAYQGLWLPDQPNRILDTAAAFTAMNDEYALRFEEKAAVIFKAFPSNRAWRRALERHLAEIRRPAATDDSA